jgi:hypothetical protein
MEHCNELCTKEVTDQCALCDALAERDRFERLFWAVVTSCNKGRRWLQGHKLSALLIIVGLGFLGFLIYESWREINSPITCNPPFEKLASYLQIQLREQHPIEPTFSGELFFRSFDPIDAGVTAMAVQISEGRTYAAHVHSLKTTWDEKNKHLSSNDEKISLIAKTRSHKYFPFDSAPFDFELTLTPPRDFSTMLITNRVHGFLMDCSEIHSNRLNAGHYHIRLVLHRSPVVQLFATTLVVVAVAFLILILWITQLTSLATSLASFFLALWSLRRILETQIKTFPTLFDCAILIICVAALLCVCGKVYTLTRPESGV